MSPKNQPGSDDESGGAFMASLRHVAKTIVNPIFLFGMVFGIAVGGGLCWTYEVLPIHGILREREAQLEKWSQLNQQMQQQTMENRDLSQAEIEKFVASNQEAATSFEDVQRYLHERELRLTETPTSLVLVPICVLGITCCAVVFFLKALNQRALATVEHVLHLAPAEMLREVVRRHTMLESPRATHLLRNDGDARQHPQE